MPICSRRQALAAFAAVAIRRPARAQQDPWAALPSLLQRIQAPKFPARDFNVTKFGAKPDGKTDASDAFTRAIAEANRAGGGRVVVPEGVFLTGAIHLKSNVNLHIAKGATIRFSPDPNQYPIVLTRFEGLECMNYSAFVYALDQENIAITGEGTLDGQSSCDHWWGWSGKGGCGNGEGNQRKARAALMEMAEKNTPVAERVMGKGSYLRPMFVQPYRCSNVLIEGVTILNSPMYEMHPVLCRNVTVRNVTVSSHGPNNDGCDPESCNGVLIDGCTFDTGDDCIAIKSGRNADGRRVGVSSQNLIIRNCTMRDGHAGTAIGSEISGSCSNVFVEKCEMSSPNLVCALRLKSNAMRGGVLQNIFMRDVNVGLVKDSVLQIDFLYEEGARGDFKPVARNVVMDHITVAETPRVLNVRGFPAATISDVRIRNSTFKDIQQPDTVVAADVKLEDCSLETAK